MSQLNLNIRLDSIIKQIKLKNNNVLVNKLESIILYKICINV